MRKFIVVFALLAMNISSICAAQSKINAATAIRSLNAQYVAAWLKGDENLVLALFEEGARLQPNSRPPIDSIANIRQFWFPKDSSVTTIHRFTSAIEVLKVQGNIAFSTQTTFLDWSYKKGTFTTGAEQRGIATTVYRKQTSGTWKIWRQMWTDIHSTKK